MTAWAEVTESNTKKQAQLILKGFYANQPVCEIALLVSNFVDPQDKAGSRVHEQSAKGDRLSHAIFHTDGTRPGIGN